jgi:uncharacterized protein YndB with AHSA1/START domain/GNAT superfamily N-acetyltransferase
MSREQEHGLQHVFELEIAAAAEAVWRALTDPEWTRRSYYGWQLDAPLVAGGPYAYRSKDGTAQIEGTILTHQPPQRLQMTARYRFDAQARHDPPHRVTWEIEPLDSAAAVDALEETPTPRCRVRVRADGFAGETTAYKLAVNDLTAVLRAMRNLLDPNALPARREQISPPVVRALTPERAGDFLHFFDHGAFADNPYWAHCYCTHFHHTTAAVHTAAENRRLADELVGWGRMQGFLAYADERPVGWCHAAPRTSISRLALMPRLQVPDAEQVGSIVCLLVARPYRRHSIARRLIEAAVERFRQQGLAYAEAYPVKALQRESEAATPLAVYLQAGFQVYRDRQGVIVRKSLLA